MLHSMAKKNSDWFLPEKVVGVFGTVYFVPAVAILTAGLLSVMGFLRNAHPAKVVHSWTGDWEPLAL